MSASVVGSGEGGVGTPSATRLPAPGDRGAGRSGGTGWLLRTVATSIPALIPVGLVVAIIVALLYASGFESFGTYFFYGTVWSPATSSPTHAVFGIAGYVIGTLLSAVPALLIALMLSVGIAVALVFYLPRWAARLLTPFVELLAGIPSVVFGIWGFWIVAPFFGGTLEPAMVRYLGRIPGFGPPTVASGVGILLAVFVLTFMIVPVTTTLIRDSLKSVPKSLVENGLALGATRWEVVRYVALRHARRGIGSAILLGFGRAVGETVAVFMVIGDALPLNGIPTNVYSLHYTIAGALVGQLDSAFIQPNYLHALAELALVLFAITLVVNVAGRRLLAFRGWGTTAEPEEGPTGGRAA